MKGLASTIVNSRNCTMILSCLYDLNEGDILVMKALAAAPESTLDDIAEAVSRDRTTVYRSLSKLLSLGMCLRKKKGIRGGGYYHVYTLVDTERIARRVESDVGDMIAGLNSLVTNFRHDFLQSITDSIRTTDV